MKQILGLIPFCIIFSFCHHEGLPSACDQQVIISSHLYATAPSDQLSIVSAEIIDDYLTIKFGSSGCDGSRWQVKLIDSGQVHYSDPPQRNIRLSLDNDELCDAYIGKEITFDITCLRITGNEVLLNLTDSNTKILYKY